MSQLIDLRFSLRLQHLECQKQIIDLSRPNRFGCEKLSIVSLRNDIPADSTSFSTGFLRSLAEMSEQHTSFETVNVFALVTVWVVTS